MSRRNLGGFIRPGYNPLRVPNAPTIGTASATSSTAASVPFTAPSCVGGSAITGYTAVSSPGCKVGTAASSPISVGCLTTGTAYTFRVYATNSYGPSAYSAASNSVTPPIQGQQAYTTAGTYSWVAPSGITSVSVVAVGGGAGGDNGLGAGSGGGGELRYKNNISVTPGNSYTVVVGDRGRAGSQNYSPAYGKAGGQSYFISSATVSANGGQPSGGAGGSGGVGDGGGNGGAGYGCMPSGGGGAGGYSGAGGRGGWFQGNGVDGSGGGGGGGQGGKNLTVGAGGGGGVGILGQGSNGSGGYYTGSTGTGGGGGSGGTNGQAGTFSGCGGCYGGGGSAGRTDCGGSFGRGGGCGGLGAVRIIWPGNTRQFPSTCTGDK